MTLSYYIWKYIGIILIYIAFLLDSYYNNKRKVYLYFTINSFYRIYLYVILIFLEILVRL